MPFHPFKKELQELQPYYEQILEVGANVRRHIQDSLSSYGVQAEPIIIGSTSPKRLTTVFDPVSPDNRYPADFDIAILVREELSLQEQKQLLHTTFPEGTDQRSFGDYIRNTEIQRFPVHAGFLPESRAESFQPLQYHLSANLSENEKDITRALRLFALRTGTYGGYTQGFKGIALEHIAVMSDTFAQAAEWLHTQATSVAIPPRLISYDGTDNLVRNVSAGVWKRTNKYSGQYLQSGHVPQTPYTIGRWRKDHSRASRIFTLEDNPQDPFDTYKQVRRFLRRAGGQQDPDADVFVIPHRKANEALISIYGQESDQIKQGVLRRWNSK